MTVPTAKRPRVLTPHESRVLVDFTKEVQLSRRGVRRKILAEYAAGAFDQYPTIGYARNEPPYRHFHRAQPAVWAETVPGRQEAQHDGDGD